MQRLPFALSIPHGGLETPLEFRDLVIASAEDQKEDIDHLTREIFGVPRTLVAHQVVFDIARTFVDLNRDPDHWGVEHSDGVVKTLTHLDRPVFSQFPSDEVITQVLERLYHPYHEALSAIAADPEILLILDCHSMAPFGLTVSPDHPGQPRPLINLGHRGGATAPLWVVEQLRAIMAEIYNISCSDIAIDHPFNGGYITNTHARSNTWAIQIEFNRAFYLNHEEGKSAPRLEPHVIDLWRDRFARTLQLLYVRAFSDRPALIRNS